MSAQALSPRVKVEAVSRISTDVTEKNPADWTVPEVASWVAKKFGKSGAWKQAVEAFTENEIAGTLLLDLSENDMVEDMGLKRFAARNMGEDKTWIKRQYASQRGSGL